MPASRCETLVTTGQVVIAGEVTTDAYVDAAEIARDTIKEIGYTHPRHRLRLQLRRAYRHPRQSPDIARGVDQAEDDDEENRAPATRA